jgi:hypothetical protein
MTIHYAFSPGIDIGRSSALEHYRNLLRCRPQTILIEQTNINDLEKFLKFLECEHSISRPCDSFLIVSHGSDNGTLEMETHWDENGKEIKGTTFEVLENACNLRTIIIPDELINPRYAGSPPMVIFYIRACSVGVALPFLEKFKEALGGRVNVSAPKHLLTVSRLHDRGTLEFLLYNFKIIRKDLFRTKSDAVNAFTAEIFGDIYGTPIKPENWGNWIPPNPNRREFGTNIVVQFGQQVDGDVACRSKVIFSHNGPKNVTAYTYTIPVLSNNPRPNREKTLAILSSKLAQDPLFKTTHQFPIFKRYGYNSVEEFFQGFNWSFNYTQDTIVCTGARNVYVVNVPITNPATGFLLFNYYPDDKKPNLVIEDLNQAPWNSILFQEV